MPDPILEQQLREAQSELACLRSQTLAQVHDQINGFCTALYLVQHEVAALGNLVRAEQLATVELRGAVDLAFNTLIEMIRSLPCRHGGNGAPCDHDLRDTERPPPMVVVRGGE